MPRVNPNFVGGPWIASLTDWLDLHAASSIAWAEISWITEGLVKPSSNPPSLSGRERNSFLCLGLGFGPAETTALYFGL